jgi:D-glycero-D-manno-heptose 1,7-bisphosphate phosphatase
MSRPGDRPDAKRGEATSSARRAAVFFDRDGTLTIESEWVRSAHDLVLLEGAAEAVARLSRAGYAVVLITNQSAVARGIISEAELGAIHAAFAAQLEARGAHLDGIYACPHHPTEGSAPYRRECECRKPKSALIERAARELDLDLARSWIVGDAERDLVAGARLGVRGILVSTGKGSAERQRLVSAGSPPVHFTADAASAAELILALDQGR